MKIFFSAGEPSGDLHAANLIRALRSERDDVEAVGLGGPEMAAAGCELHADMTSLSVMWFLRVLLKLHVFARHLSRADRYFRHHRPDAVVLVDFPGFNWWVARRAKAHGIPVFYYVPPQIWAWARWRIKKMRRFVDHVLCALPFEETWFRDHGCRGAFIGHPFFDEVRRYELDEAFVGRLRGRPGPLVAILPGSRTQEVVNNLPWFLKAARIVHQRVPDVRLAIAAYRPYQAELAKKMVAESGLEAEVYVRKTPELIHLATCCMAVSGSVSLELLYHAKPTVVLYWISRFAYRVQQRFRKVKYISLVNLLRADDPFPDDITHYDPAAPSAERVLYPEYLTYEDKAEQIAAHVVDWLTDEEERSRLVGELETLRTEVAQGGASRRAAHYILDMLDAMSAKKAPVARPHFRPGMFVASSGVEPAGVVDSTSPAPH